MTTPYLVRRWTIIAALISALMLATAHGFEHFGGLAPCELCYRQRDVYWVAMALGVVLTLIQFMKSDIRVLRGGLALLGLVFLTGALIAGYHAGVEWKFWPGPAACTGTLDELSQLGGDLLAALDKPSEAPKCDEIQWAMFGISMAGWNALASLLFAATSFKLASFTSAKEVTL